LFTTPDQPSTASLIIHAAAKKCTVNHFDIWHQNPSLSDHTDIQNSCKLFMLGYENEIPNILPPVLAFFDVVSVLRQLTPGMLLANHNARPSARDTMPTRDKKGLWRAFEICMKAFDAYQTLVGSGLKGKMFAVVKVE
jgi:hypothetical protein